MQTLGKYFILKKKLHVHKSWRLITACWAGFLRPCRHSSSPRPFLISCTGSDVHTEVKKNCFNWLSFMPSIFWVTPDIQNKGMWLIFPTNYFQGLLLSWVIRHVPALLHCFCCRAGMVVWHFQIHFKFQKKKDRKGKKLGAGVYK